MSINTIIANPIILTELKNAIGKGSGSGSGSINLYTRNDSFLAGSFQTFNTSFEPSNIESNKPVMITTTINVPDGVSGSNKITYELFINGGGSPYDSQTAYAYTGVNLTLTFVSVFIPSSAITSYLPQISCLNTYFFESSSNPCKITTSVIQ